MKNLGVLTELFGEQVSQLNEDQAKVVSEKLDRLLETRVDAKVKYQTEVIEEEAREKYETQLKEATEKFSGDLKSLEEGVYKKAEDYKQKIKKSFDEVSSKLKEEKDKEVETFISETTEKLNKYLKYELDRSIPQTYVEAVAKLQILEPVVEGCKKSFEDNYMKIEENSTGLLMDAKEEIVKTREENASLVKENMEIAEELISYKRSAKISEVCEGLTDAQREKTSKLLESYDVDEIQERFDAIREYIIEGDEKKEEEEVEDSKEEEEKEEGKEETVTKADNATEVAENVQAETEADTMSVPETVEEALDPKTADAEAVKDDNRLIESWAEEFRKRI